MTLDPATQQTLTSLVGVAGAPVVAQLVASLIKPFTPDVRFYAPAAIVLGIGWNLLITLALAEASGAHPLLLPAAIIGVLTGLAAAGWTSSTRAEVNQDLAARGVAIIPNPPPK